MIHVHVTLIANSFGNITLHTQHSHNILIHWNYYYSYLTRPQYIDIVKINYSYLTQPQYIDIVKIIGNIIRKSIAYFSICVMITGGSNKTGAGKNILVSAVSNTAYQEKKYTRSVKFGKAWHVKSWIHFIGKYNKSLQSHSWLLCSILNKNWEKLPSVKPIYKQFSKLSHYTVLI